MINVSLSVCNNCSLTQLDDAIIISVKIGDYQTTEKCLEVLGGTVNTVILFVIMVIIPIFRM